MIRQLTFAMTMAVASACAGDAVVVPQSDEAFLSVVVAPDAAAPSAVSLHAFLLRAGTPLRSPYLVASRFEMRRLSDGAMFDWRLVAQPDSAVGSGNEFVLPSEGNYELPRIGTAGLLGRQDITEGETYSLMVEVEGRTVTGTVTVPGMPVIVRTAELAKADSLLWRSASGARGYSVVSQDFVSLSTFTTDTLFRFESRRPDNTSNKGTVVRAYEPQLFAYLTDRRLGRAGLQGALGVFGAYNSDSLPPRWAVSPIR